MATKDEAKVTQEQVEKEHLTNVRIGMHWGYLASVLFGSLLVMLIFIALLGASV